MVYINVYGVHAERTFFFPEWAIQYTNKKTEIQIQGVKRENRAKDVGRDGYI